ncbi:hypothetical protein GUJ93_ZPchr0001g32329 [Zizania palustris]|uniref:Uncharacterized protein n=1 Tax=Zizania palustris TaxID=103762 RepID=A0A8J5S4R2_ZIZPA|nr:hypothetical protein GUJ93_ZPchr0001g32329 [Zizania palustris]
MGATDGGAREPAPEVTGDSRQCGIPSLLRRLSSTPGDGTGGDEWGSSWSTGITKDHFDGSAGAVGSPAHSPSAPVSPELAAVRAVERDNRESKAFLESWNDRMRETCELLKQVREPGSRGAYDSDKLEMYRLHKEDPETYTVERLDKDFRVMRQRVHAILWLKELEEEEKRKRGKPLDDSVEILLDSCPEYVRSSFAS